MKCANAQRYCQLLKIYLVSLIGRAQESSESCSWLLGKELSRIFCALQSS